MTDVSTVAAAGAINASKIYGKDDSEVRALDDVTVDFALGQFTAIMGPSGSGKSTLMHCLAGLDALTSGRVLIGDTDLAQLDDKQLTSLRREKVGFIFQNFNLLGHLTVYENVALPLSYHTGIKRNQYKAAVLSALKRVGMADYTDRFPAQLSGGQQQRVAIARAIVTKPKLLLADEPTGNLDSENSENVMQLLTELNQQGTALCLITHDQQYASQAKRIIHLKDGQISAIS